VNEGQVYNFPMNFYDRPTVALARLVGGDADAGMKALFTPQELTPSERKDLASRFKGNKLMAMLADIATNPLVIIGAVLSIKYPLKALPLLKRFDLGGHIGKLARRLSVNERVFGVPDRIFGGFKGFLDDMWKKVEGIANFKEKYTLDFSKAIGAFERTMGRGPNKQEASLLYHVLDGAHTSKGYVGKRVIPVIQKELGVNLRGKPLLNLNAVEPKLRKALLDTAGEIRKVEHTLWSSLPEKTRKVIAAQAVSRNSDPMTVLHNITVGGKLTKLKRGKLTAGGIEALVGKEETYYAPHFIKNIHFYAEGKVLNERMVRKFVESRLAGRSFSHSVLARRGITLPDLDALDDIAPYLNQNVHKALRSYEGYYAGRVKSEVMGYLNRFSGDPAMLELEVSRFLTRKYGMAQARANHIAVSLSKYGEEGLDRAIANVGQIPQYRTDLIGNFQQHINSMAPTWAGIQPSKVNKGMTLDQSLYKEANIMKNAGHGGRARYNLWVNDYQPLLAGRRTLAQTKHHQMWQEFKIGLYDSLQQSGLARKIKGQVGGGKVYKFLEDALVGERSPVSPGSFGSKLTAWFYHGTLGFNPSPPIKNLMQPIITTTNVFGPSATLGGMKRLSAKFPEYLSNLRKFKAAGQTLGMADELAMKKVWPGFVAHNLQMYPQLSGAMETTSVPALRAASRALEAGKSASMFMMTTTERFNRLLTWETALGEAVKEGLWTGKGMLPEAVGKLGASAVRLTQFPAGLMGIPHGVLNLPGPLRQFTQFPMRMVDFLATSTRFGGGNRRNWGTIGRAMTSSAVAYEVGKHALNMDLSGGLLFGALPEPYKGAPFYPFPFVPPVVSTAGALASAGLQGTTEGLSQRLSPLIPGGLAMTRVRRYVAPDRADYSQYKTTGRIPVFDRNGLLKGNYTPTQLFARSIGLKTLDVSQERELTGYLIKQRDIMREYKREYLNALSRNDVKRAEEIKKEWRERYPELGPLKVKKGEIEMLEKRRQVARMERIMKSLPRGARALFGQLAGVSMAENIVGDMERGLDIGMYQ